MPSPQEFINDLKEELLLSNIGNNENDRRAIDKHLKRLNNALEKLSIELYKKDTHFILELIQNADDNQYLDNSTPFIRFGINQKRIIIQNNEKGFTEENVNSLCDVGESTKSERYKGYIGEKGIGFKSVFKVSDSPQVFSNGFHFRFRRENQADKLGFIVPHWVDNIPNDVNLELTNIVLSFNKDGKNKSIKKITNISRELNHEVILFLNKIKEIEISNEVNESLICISRTDLDGIIIIKELIYEQRENEEKPYSVNNEYCYKLIEQEIKVPNDIKEEKRENIDKTKIVLGFPLSKERTIISVKQKVFAYLPVQEYGFKFLIQADFILPSNRENINNDNDWNQWLLKTIPFVFLKAVEYFKQDNLLKHQYYNYLPRLEEIVDLQFYSMAKSLYKLLEEHDCILTESGKWRKPSDVLLVDKGIRELFSSQDIYKLIKKEYISNDVNKQVDTYVLNALGVHNFSSNDLLSCLSKTTFMSRKSDDWLVKLYLYLYNTEANNKISVNDLRYLKILRLNNNVMTSVNEGVVFLHIPDGKDYGLDELRSLKPVSSSKAETFIKNIGVFDNHPTTIINEYIIPIFQDNTWKSKDNKVLVCLLKYIKDNKLKLAQNEVNNLKSNLWIKNSHPNNCQFSRSSSLFFSKDYYYNKNQDFDVVKEIIEPNKFISQDYIVNESEIEITLWKELFIILGIQEISLTKVIEYILDVFTDNSKWTNIKHETHLKYINYIKNNYEYIYDEQLAQKIKNTLWLKNSNPEIMDNPNQLCYSKSRDVYLVSNPNNHQDDLQFLLEIVMENNYFVSNDYFRNSLEVSQWQKFFKWLGMKEITSYEIVKNFILPLYEEQDKSKNYLSKSTDINFKCVLYIKDNFEQLSKDKNLLKDIKRLLWIECFESTTGSTAYWIANNLYLGNLYGNEVNLESLLKDIQVYFVSSLYLDNIFDDKNLTKYTEEINSWRSFFAELGVNTNLSVEIVSSIISLNEYDKNKLLLQTLDKNWAYYKAQCQENSYSSNEALWFTKLKTSAWIPTTERALAKPCEVFIDKPSIRNVLNNSVLYVGIKLTNANFIKDITINTTPTVLSILDRLKQVSKFKSKDKDLLTELYILLSNNFDEYEIQIKSAFKKNNLIYVPNTLQSYFSLDQVFWNDSKSIFGNKLRGYLHEHYPKLYSLFVDKLEVKQVPNYKDYANVLLDISKQTQQTSEDKKIIWRVYRELDKYLNSEQIKASLISQQFWWTDFIVQSIFYSHKNRFSRNHQNLFVSDDEELFTLFKQNQEIEFLQLPPDSSYYQIKNFIDTIGIKYISDSVEIRLYINETPIQQSEITQKIQDFLPYILCYFYHREHKVFDCLKHDNTLKKFQELQCYSVNKLTLEYILKEQSVLSEKNIFLDKNNNRLYVHNNYLYDTDRLAIELAKFFGNVKALEDFLIALFDKKTEEKIEKYLKVKKILDLPIEEKEFFGLSEVNLTNDDFSEDDLEEITENNDISIENDYLTNNVILQDKLDINSQDLTGSLQQTKNQSETTSEHLHKILSNTKQLPQDSTYKAEPEKYQLTDQELQKKLKHSIELPVKTDRDREINKDIDDEIDDIDLNLTNNVDRRERITTEIVQRPEQVDFRNRLLQLYAYKCAITDYNADSALIAAHIIPYKISQDDRSSNGLLLRADIHILFDRHLIAINSTKMIVKVTPKLTNTKYAELEGKKLNLPKVSKKALKWHHDKCQWV